MQPSESLASGVASDKSPEDARGTPSHLDRIASFLEHYKALFEVGAATLLGVMAIVVSLAQTCWAKRQTDLLALQTKIFDAQALPQFAFRRTVSPGGDMLTMETRGSVFRVVSVSVYDSLRVNVVSSGLHQVGLAPVVGYFDDAQRTVSSSLTSISFQISGRQIAAIRSLAGDLSHYNYTRTRFFVRSNFSFKADGIASLIRIKYLDLLNREHTAWFVSSAQFDETGDVPVLQFDDKTVREVIKDWSRESAIPINAKLRRDLMEKLAPVILKTAA